MTQNTPTPTRPRTSTSAGTLHKSTRARLDTSKRDTLHDTVSDVFTTAAHQLRYEAVLEAVLHMGNDVTVADVDGFAVGRRAAPFATVCALPEGRIIVGLAVGHDLDERLQPCTEARCDEHIHAQFELSQSEPIRGWQLGLLRKAYRLVG